MKLAQLLEGIPVTKFFHTHYGRFVPTQDVEIHQLQYDSRKVEKEDCFIAIRGTGADGHHYIGTAIERGAKVIVLENDQVLPDSYFMHAGVAKVVVPDSRKALALMAATYYGHPSRKLTMVGVTGTNGKTTTSHIIKSICEAAGNKVGLIGTIEYMIGNERRPATHTTPESLELQSLLAQMVERGCTTVSMEVSSHALHQSRVHGVEYTTAVFTNLTQDHLDYHGSMEEYYRTKNILFESLSPAASAVINIDDPWSSRFLTSTRARAVRFGSTPNASVYPTDIELSINGTNLIIHYEGGSIALASSLVGRFNVSNILASFSAGYSLGFSAETIKHGIEQVKNVRGRFERVASPAGWSAIIDYAHTPDALEKCLMTLHDVLPSDHRGTIITVFGAGGDRDKTKRPLMGTVASRLSDLTIVTSDNPRTENPEQIIDDVIRGVVPSAQVLRVTDRRNAIQRAIQLAHPSDTILIAGKGHEEYQVIGKEKLHFSDREVVEELMHR
ncbi:MAG: UDP-N-acetylmuramoyl-L-alanyl-D-glutamate--2,6-diaminopimelate ligase [bacterium]